MKDDRRVAAGPCTRRSTSPRSGRPGTGRRGPAQGHPGHGDGAHMSPPPNGGAHKSYQPAGEGRSGPDSRKRWQLIASAKRPDLLLRRRRDQLGARRPRSCLTDFIRMTGYPVHPDTLMGLGCLSRLGQASFWACWGCMAPTKRTWPCTSCDVMINVGARFDDRVTGRLADFSPGSKKIHIDIDPSLDQQERCTWTSARRRRCRAHASR